MDKWKWYLNRLRAMSLAEVVWRIAQKWEERRERHFAQHPISVSDHVFNPRLTYLTLAPHHLGIAFESSGHTQNSTIHLLGDYDYETYKTRWHAGFQTNNEWPKTFAYDLDYKQNDRIGDARTNWELNRHFQFALLAKNFFFSRDERYLGELAILVDDWTRENPFLTGISWTSVMETAIRAINWMYALAFVKASGNEDNLVRSLNTGIVNMLDHVERHRSRYSSANNHLIVEAASLAIGGYALGYAPWRETGIAIMTEELSRQNYEDGVNKEMSLHYQMFVMEAYALTAHCIATNGDIVPDSWIDYLQRMCTFVSHSSFDATHAMAFGDDDEGKILDLQGGANNSTDYVQQLCSLIVGQRFSPFDHLSETVRCLFAKQAIDHIQTLPLYNTGDGKSFPIGGYTFMRSHDQRMLIGIDHAPLGFGAIAAHGHADALSFQLMIDGQSIFADPGTYIYHCDIASRNAFRQTLHHNTVAVEGRDQSEMLGAFIWGRKAHCRLINQQDDGQHWTLTAEHDGYAPIIHRRTFDFNKQERRLTIIDKMSRECHYTITFVLSKECTVDNSNGYLLIRHGRISCQLQPPSDTTLSIDTVELSEHYGTKAPTTAIRFHSHHPQAITTIAIL